MRENLQISYCIQGTPEWFSERKGLFTGSEIDRLMGTKDASEKYALEKKAERFFGISQEEMDTFVNYMCYQSPESSLYDFKGKATALRYGHIMEPIARRYYEKKYSETVRECGFIKLNELVGCSPDGLLKDKDGGIEIKNPESLANHYSALHLECPEDLKKYSKKYYWQVLTCLYVTGAKYWDFVSFAGNPAINPEHTMACLSIYSELVKDDLKELEDKIESKREFLLNVK